MKKRALLSVSDKTGVVEFARRLSLLGFEIVSTGGTERAIKEAGIACINVSQVTGFPECLDGRVKTLHPAIHAGVLAMRDNPAHMAQLEELDVTPIDVVAINLYPFKQTILKEGVTREEAIENIDIGGPTMIRAAAKNWQDVSVVVDPADYETVLAELEEKGTVSRETRFHLASKVFEHTASYDALISSWWRKQEGSTLFPEALTLTFEKVQSMRYGENPHQNAAFYKEVGAPAGTLPCAKQLHGKELSYNNINDTNGALDLLKEFDGPAVVGVKHANPCGVGVDDDIFTAWQMAYEADPVSIFGGIVALNRPVNLAIAKDISDKKVFLEIIIAPSFDEDAFAVLSKKKNLRLLELPAIAQRNCAEMMDMKKVAGGLLVQELNCSLMNEDDLKVVTDRAPTEEEMEQLRLAWKVVKHTKSNGIALVKGRQSVGIGPGQTNRVTALELAIKYAGDKAQGSVMGSDAFFPFDDCVEAAAKAGITAIIQPGGSIRDEDSIIACNKYGIAMVFTGMRHFKH